MLCFSSEGSSAVVLPSSSIRNNGSYPNPPTPRGSRRIRPSTLSCAVSATRPCGSDKASTQTNLRRPPLVRHVSQLLKQSRVVVDVPLPHAAKLGPAGTVNARLAVQCIDHQTAVISKRQSPVALAYPVAFSAALARNVSPVSGTDGTCRNSDRSCQANRSPPSMSRNSRTLPGLAVAIRRSISIRARPACSRLLRWDVVQTPIAILRAEP